MIMYENARRYDIPGLGLCFIIKNNKDRAATKESFADFYPSIEINGTIYKTKDVGFAKSAVDGVVKEGASLGIIVEEGVV